MRYHIPSDTWEVIQTKDHPTDRSDHCSCIYRDKMYIFSGMGLDSIIHEDLWCFNLKTSKWKCITVFRHFGVIFAANVIYKGKWYIFGGDSTGDFKGNKKFFYIDLTNNTIHQLTDTNFENICVQACEINGKIYSYGGIKDGQVADFYCYDIEFGIWKEMISMKIPMSSYACVAWKDSMYLYGGYQDKKYLTDLYKFDTLIEQWTLFNFEGEVPSQSCFPRGGVYQGVLYIYGGFSGKECTTATNKLSYLRIERRDLNWNFVKSTNIRFHFK